MHILLIVDVAILCIENKKNSVKNQIINYKAKNIKNRICTISLLQKLIITLRKDRATKNTLLCVYKLDDS